MHQIFPEPAVTRQWVLDPPHLKPLVVVYVPVLHAVNVQVLSPMPRHHAYVVPAHLQPSPIPFVIQVLRVRYHALNVVSSRCLLLLPEIHQSLKLALAFRVEHYLAVQVVPGVFHAHRVHYVERAFPEHNAGYFRNRRPYLDLLSVPELHNERPVPVSPRCISSHNGSILQVAISFEQVMVFRPQVVVGNGRMMRYLLHCQLVMAHSSLQSLAQNRVEGLTHLHRVVPDTHGKRYNVLESLQSLLFTAVELNLRRFLKVNRRHLHEHGDLLQKGLAVEDSYGQTHIQNRTTVYHVETHLLYEMAQDSALSLHQVLVQVDQAVLYVLTEVVLLEKGVLTTTTELHLV